MHRRHFCTLILLLLGASAPAMADRFNTEIDMRSKGGATFYVPGQITGLGAVELMVDTGSGYMTINEEILETLKDGGQATFVKDLRGRLANGSELQVPVYAIKALSIGEACWMRNVEAAVFPGSTRPILGLNVLQRAGPFIFSFDPPRLVLSRCDARVDSDTAGIAAWQE
jgi:predicted aspartyl protease